MLQVKGSGGSFRGAGLRGNINRPARCCEDSGRFAREHPCLTASAVRGAGRSPDSQRFRVGPGCGSARPLPVGDGPWSGETMSGETTRGNRSAWVSTCVDRGDQAWFRESGPVVSMVRQRSAAWMVRAHTSLLHEHSSATTGVGQSEILNFAVVRMEEYQPISNLCKSCGR